MYLLKSREWALPNGETWKSWLIQWVDSQGREQRRVFATFEEALRSYESLVGNIRKRKDKHGEAA